MLKQSVIGSGINKQLEGALVQEQHQERYLMDNSSTNYSVQPMLILRSLSALSEHDEFVRFQL